MSRLALLILVLRTTNYLPGWWHHAMLLNMFVYKASTVPSKVISLLISKLRKRSHRSEEILREKMSNFLVNKTTTPIFIIHFSQFKYIFSLSGQRIMPVSLFCCCFPGFFLNSVVDPSYVGCVGCYRIRISSCIRPKCCQPGAFGSRYGHQRILPQSLYA